MKGCTVTELDKKLREIYKDLDEELSVVAPPCRACGECCHFDRYDHTLYVSRLEVDHLINNAGLPETASKRGACPYQVDNKCTVREYRPLGCRTFYCQEDWKNTSHDVYEKYLRRIKGLCAANGLKWSYADMLILLEKAPRRSSCVA